MARVLITGANGHIGANTTRAVLERGHRVVAFVRRTSDLRGLNGLDLDYRYGDIMRFPSVQDAVGGCDVVIHLATAYRTWDPDPGEIIDPGVVGAGHIFEAARQAGVKRLIYVSSGAAVGYGWNPDEIRTPDDWNTQAENAYYVAKTDSEREAWRMAESTGVPMLSFCPTIILGPLDYRVTPSNGFIRDLLDGKQTTYVGGSNYGDVRDVAGVLASAIEAGTPGERYIVGGENIPLTRLRDLLGDLTGIRPGHMALPRPLVLAVASVTEAVGRLTRTEPLYTRGLVHENYDRYAYFDCSKTYQTFGYLPRDTREMLKDCIDWLIEIEALKPRTVQRIQAYRAGQAEG